MAIARSSERRKALAFAAALAVAVTGLAWAGQILNRVDIPAMSSPIAVSMRLQGSSWETWYNASGTVNGTVFAFLLEAAAAQGFVVTWSSWGPPLSAVLVESIKGEANGAGGRFWQFWVDGRYSDLSADHAVLHDRAFVEWRFVPAGTG